MSKSSYTKDDLVAAHIINLRLVENWSTEIYIRVSTK